MSERLTEETLRQFEAGQQALFKEVRASWAERDAAQTQVAKLRGYLTRIGCMLPRFCPGPNAVDPDLCCTRCGALKETAP